jgi:Domain of unknown function (DUF5655)
MGAAMPKALWRCPRCGRRFANRNQWHSCVPVTVRDHLRGKPTAVVALYREFARMVRGTGPLRVHPVKTRIAFISRMTFAGAVLRKDRLDVHFILARRLRSRRFRTVERYGPRSVGHYLSIRSLDELDDELRGWLEEAAAVGRQEHLAGMQSGATRSAGGSRSRRRDPRSGPGRTASPRSDRS